MKYCAFMVSLDSGDEKVVKENSKDALMVTVNVWRGMGYAVNHYFQE